MRSEAPSRIFPAPRPSTDLRANMFEIFKEDIKRYFPQSRDSNCIASWEMAKAVLQNETLWIIGMYRLGKWLRSFHIPVVSPLLKFIYAIISRPAEIFLHVYISLEAEIGRGFSTAIAAVYGSARQRSVNTAICRNAL